MSKESRIQLIQEIQRKRNSHLITYVTSTRPGCETQMAMDSIRRIYEHLIQIPREENLNIDLLLHSNGGDGIVPWKLVTLIREFSNKFSVLIPHCAFSAATLTALGADEIVMHPMGMLGPTDATVSNQFNPVDSKGNTLGISSEDVTAYISLIKEDAGITHEDELVSAFNYLADKVHPLALGNVKRSLSQSRMMAKKLLSLHIDSKRNHEIVEVVDNLTSKLYYHGHPINREEAKEIGIKTIAEKDSELEALIWNLYLEYEKEMELNTEFRPTYEFIRLHSHVTNTDLGSYPVKLKVAYIESEFKSFVREVSIKLLGTQNSPGVYNISISQEAEKWTEE